MEELKDELIESLLNTLDYDELTEGQNKLVVQYEIYKLKPKVDEMLQNITYERAKAVIHDWWLDYQIADGTEEALISYIKSLEEQYDKNSMFR